ncbi:MAG: toxic anion resistance protein [Lachnospiraceae bacterium]|nr:toxic anion resistance protein [Lachnospiraceae bacterium]
MAFTLDIPEKEEIKKLVEEELTLAPEEIEGISEESKEKGNEILAVDLDSSEGRIEIRNAIEEFGSDVVKQSAKKNELLKTRLNELSKAGEEGGAVAAGLEQLSRQMKDLDPTGIDFTKKGLFGKIFNPVRSYFDKFQTADGAIADIVKSLDKGASVLQDDNVTLELEQASLRDLTKQLNRKMQLGEDLDKYLTANIQKSRAEGGDEEKLKFIEEEVLFPLRQRMIDFSQMQAVNQNGIVAMEVIRKNNLELIRSVNRAQTVTVSALTTAVTVAGALFNQKIVLEKVQTLNAATNNMIAATSNMLKEQGVEVQKQAIESNIDVATMKTAFKDTLEALESISTYKQDALPKMRQTIDEFREMTDEGEKILQRMEKTGDLKELPADDQKKIEEKK